MPDFWIFLTSTALFDSLSTAIQIVIFVFLLSTRRPLAHALAFFAGTSLAYLACGLVFLYNREAVNAWLALFLPNMNSIPDPSYYGLQLAFGALCVVLGIVFAFRSQKQGLSPMFQRLTLLIRFLNPLTAFALGAFLSITGFPVSVPYLGALEKLGQAYGNTGAWPGVLYYNAIYAVPMLIPLILYLLLRNHVTDIEAKLHFHTPRWGSMVNSWLTALLGLVFVLDSAAYFGWGHALLPSRFF
ncbi:MAG: hypothetical protein HKM05_09140 [Spirochaetales bacterium]|nr:hypothetical protein [Spirochaetales bacterium]